LKPGTHDRFLSADKMSVESSYIKIIYRLSQLCVVCLHCLSAEWLPFVCTFVSVLTDDIQIRFFELSPDGELVWEAYPDLSDLDVHHQVT